MDQLTPEQIQEMQSKIASLQAERDELSAGKMAAEKKADEIAGEKAKAIADAATRAKELEKKAADLQAENSSLKQENNKLSPKPVTIEVDGKEYQFTSPKFHHSGVDHSSAEFAATVEAISSEKPDILSKEQVAVLTTLQHLIDKAPGVLVEVE